MYQPSIYLFSYLIQEPVTVFTDIILCCSCIMFGLNVGKSYAKKWSYFLYKITIASFFCAFGHDRYLYKNNILQLISHSTNIIAVYVATLASLTLFQYNNLKLFWEVKLNAITGLALFVGGVNILLAIKGNIFISVGLIIYAISAYLHSNKISISKWFNHNDISHVIMIFDFYFIAKRYIKLHENYAIN